MRKILLLAVLTATVARAEPPARHVEGPPVPALPPVSAPVFRLPKLVPRPPGTRPSVPPGFVVEPLVGGLESPRSLLVLPNGDVLVALARTEGMAGLPPAVVEALTRQGMFGPSPNRVVLLRRRGAMVETHEFLAGLRQPFGLLLLDGWLYVANTDAVVRWKYRPGATRLGGAGEKIADLPAGTFNNHWTRNLVATPDGRQILVSVGAATDVNAERLDEPERAAILAMNPDGSGRRVYASGLRNPVGLAWRPGTTELWTTVNERDGLGEDVPPDYLTRAVEGAFYGWPYVYYGTYADPTWKRLDPVRVADAAERARVPDLALGGHCVPLGLLFPTGLRFPPEWREGAFVARRGGGSRAHFIGFDVAFVRFRGGAPTGEIRPFLAGFVADDAKAEVYGRPVYLAAAKDGSLLVSDDAGGTIWRVNSVTVNSIR